MPEFSYKARDDRGEARTGVIEAESQSAAATQLRSQGLVATRITIATRMIDADAVLTEQAARKVKREDVVAFSNQLAVMLQTGVPLAEAIDAYTRQSRGGSLGRISSMLTDRIESGVSFSAAIAEFPRVFPSLMVSLVRASEASGSMGPMLERVATYLGDEMRTRRQIRGALIYPIIMLVMGLGVTGFLVAWVLPRFASIYEGRDAALPRPTQMLLGLSDIITTNWVALLVAAVAVVGAIALGKSTAVGRRLVDGALLGAPVVGPIFRNFYLTRIARTLSTLLASGVQLKEALRIVRGVTGSHQWEEFLTQLDTSIDSGRSISDAVLDSPLIPPAFAQMIAAGERTGNLAESLERVADVAEEQFEDSVSTGTQLIEPVMIVVLGGVIGAVAIALLLPIFTMGKAMSG
jgi:type IV pilus assembly protein PilC